MPCHNKVCEFKSALKLFQVLVAHFQHVAEARESTADVCGRARFISNKLCDYRVLRFIMYMQDVLKIIATLSLAFQKTGSTCLDVLHALDTACLQLTELSMAPGPTYLEFLDDIQHDDDTHTNRGVELTHYVERDYNDMGVMCTTVLDSVSARLDSHTDTSMVMLKAARVFDTREWPLERADLPGFGNVQIQALTEHFHPMFERLNVDEAQIQRQWTKVKAHLGFRLFQRPRPDPLPSVSSLFLTARDCFPAFLKLAEIVICLPVSSAICERGFSCLKRIKCDWRSSLTTSQLNNLMLVSIQGPSVEEYYAQVALQRWWEQGQRQRRPAFQANARPHEDQPEVQEDELLHFLLGDQPWFTQQCDVIDINNLGGDLRDQCLNNWGYVFCWK